MMMVIKALSRLSFKFIKIWDKVITKNDNLMVICSNSLSDNLLYFYFYLRESEFKDIEIKVLTKGKSDIELKNELRENKLKNIFLNFDDDLTKLKIKKFRSLTGFWNFIKAKYVVMKESDGYFQSYFQNSKNKIFVCLWHGIPMKAIGLLNKENNIKIQNKKDFNWTHFLVSSILEKEIMKKSWKLTDDQIIINGYPRNEYLLKNKNNERLQKEIRNKIIDKLGFTPTKIIMYAPTYRSIETAKFFPFNDFEINVLKNYCEQNDVLFILRTHVNEYNEYQEGIINLNSLLESKHFILGDDFSEMQNYLLIIDILLTDYSGSFYDFLLMDKPIFIIPYDYHQYEKRRGFSVDMKDMIKNLSINNLAELLDRIDKNEIYYEKLRDFFETSKNQFHNYEFDDVNSISENILKKISENKDIL
tara:strand:- start:4407 stop:5660 length:1254 start_codon:yes stop_codon:yes gene_type:complete